MQNGRIKIVHQQQLIKNRTASNSLRIHGHSLYSFFIVSDFANLGAFMCNFVVCISTMYYLISSQSPCFELESVDEIEHWL